MPKRDPKALLLRMGKARRGPRDDRDLPNFTSPRAGKHTRIPGRGKHKAKPGRY